MYALTAAASQDGGNVNGSSGSGFESQIQTLESVGIKSSTQFFLQDLESDDDESESDSES